LVNKKGLNNLPKIPELRGPTKVKAPKRRNKKERGPKRIINQEPDPKYKSRKRYIKQQ